MLRLFSPKESQSKDKRQNDSLNYQDNSTAERLQINAIHISVYAACIKINGK